MIRNPPKKIAVRLREKHFRNAQYTHILDCAICRYLKERFHETAWRFLVTPEEVLISPVYVTINGRDLVVRDTSLIYKIPSGMVNKLIDRHNPSDDDYLKPLNFTLTRIDK